MQTTSSGHAAQWSQGFSADFSYIDSSKPQSSYRGKIYANVAAQPRAVVVDTEYPGSKEIRTIWRQDRDKTVSIDFKERVFWERASAARSALGSSAELAAPEILGRIVASHKFGVEEVDGRSAVRWEVVTMDEASHKERWEYWQDQRLHICVKANIAGKKEYRLSNILEKRQPAELFDIPPGFRRVASVPGAAR